MTQFQQAPDSTHPLRIRHCRAGRVTDATLDSATAAARRLQNGENLSEAEAQLILLTLPQICDELRQRRAAMDLISDCTDIDNVRFLPAGGA